MDALTRAALAAQHGDEQALTAFVETGYPEVWRLCAALVDRQSANDLAQDTFVRAIHALTRYRADSSARTWLLAIARHACLDELRSRVRRRRRDATVVEGLAGRPAEISSHDASEPISVTNLIAQLDPDRRAAFVLTQMLGLSYEEAAQVCGCPFGTIRSRVARARAELIEQLREPGEDRPQPGAKAGWRRR